MRQRMAQPRLYRALPHTEVAWVLVKDGREQENTKKVTLHVVCNRGRIAPAVAGRSQPKARIIPVKLRPARIPCGAQITGGINIVVYEQAKLIAGGHLAF